MSTAARTAAKDGCARSEPSPLSLGPPAHRASDGRLEPNGQEPGFYEVQDEPNGREPGFYEVQDEPNGREPGFYEVQDEPNGQEPGFYEVQDEPLRLPTPAMSSEAAARRPAPMPPIDPSPGQDHTSRTAQLPDPQREPAP